MMFIAVLVRAIACAGTACIAAVIVGIIDRPMPRPRTKLEPHRSTNEVVDVTNANGSIPSAASGRPAAGSRVGP